MLLLVVAIVAIVFHLALRRGVRPAVAVARVWARWRPSVFRYVAAAPATFIYLAIVATSNLHELSANPVKALVRSAFLLDDYTLLVSTALLATCLAPVERWLGTARWLVVFAAGHAGATIVAALGIWIAIRTGRASTSLETTVDVGVSYGFAAVGGVLTWALPGRQARVWAITIAVLLVIALVASRTFTDVGHLVAFAIGIALRPLARADAGADRPDPFAAAGRIVARLRTREWRP